MMNFFSQMMMLPVQAFVFSLEMMARTMRGLQGFTRPNADRGRTMPGDATYRRGNDNLDCVARAVMPSPADRNRSSRACSSQNPASDKEKTVDDQDLSGDDLKYVSYSILFTKRDLETVLEARQDDVVNYSTDGASYGALKVSEFFKRLSDGLKRSKLWIDRNYPSNPKYLKGKDEFTDIPSVDRKYVTFEYKVLRRMKRQVKEYDKDQVDVLREIKDKI
jgi:hypothetical protein